MPVARPPPSATIISSAVVTILFTELYLRLIIEYILYRSEVYDRIVQFSRAKKEAEAIYYNRRLIIKIFKPGDLVILYQKKIGKLEER